MPAVFVREKAAGVATPGTDAYTVYVPAAVLAVALTVTRPEASVTPEMAPSEAEAPVPGTLNVTVAPGMTMLPASRTTATSGAAKACPAAAVCPLPLTTVIELGAPWFDRLKLVEAAVPLIAADTA